jgi:hypothetical protein
MKFSQEDGKGGKERVSENPPAAANKLLATENSVADH